MRRRLAGLLLATLLTLATFAAPAAQAPARSTLRLRVLDGVTNEPLQGVQLDYRCFDAGRAHFADEGRGVTDARGEFVADVSNSSVCLVLDTNKSGFGQEQENSRQTDIGLGESVFVARIWKQAAMAGRVLNESGRPIAGTPVRLLWRREDARGVQWIASARPVVTDAQGAFHFDPLSSLSTYGLAFEEVEPLESPAPITLRPGESRTGVDVRVRPIQKFQVAGHLTTTSGSVDGVIVYLDRADSAIDYIPTTITQARADARGGFRFPAVPRGEYRLRVDTGVPAGLPHYLCCPVLWATHALSVTVNKDDVSFALRQSADIRGTVAFEGSTPWPGGRLLLMFQSVDGSGARRIDSGMVEVDAAGRLTAAGLLPGRYVVNPAAVPSGWRLKDAVTHGRDIASLPLTLGTNAIDDLVVTFTDRRTEIGGTVRRDDGAEDPEATVIVFSTDAQYWPDTVASLRRVRRVLTSQHGRYAMSALPPGDYFVTAIRTERGSFNNTLLRDVLSRLAPLATRVHLEDNAPLTQDLRRVVLPPR